MADIFFLTRFKNAQDLGVYERALAEIQSGSKRSHWMWFIFPQIVGLGTSSASQYYAIKNTDEAKAFLNDPLLGNRLREISKALLTLPDSNAVKIFGGVDAMKLRSSMTLFDYVSPNDIFAEVIEKYFFNNKDLKTLSIISSQKNNSSTNLN